MINARRAVITGCNDDPKAAIDASIWSVVPVGIFGSSICKAPSDRVS